MWGFMRVLEILTEVLMIMKQVFSPLLHSPAKEKKVKHKAQFSFTCIGSIIPEFHGASLQSSQNRRDCLSVAAGYPLPFCPLLGTVGLLTVSPETERHTVQLETRVVTGSTESFLLSHASYSARLGCGTSFHQWDNTKATRFMSNYLESGSLGNVKARTL